MRGRVLSWVRGADLGVLLTALVVVAALWAFVLTAVLVGGGYTESLDNRILVALRRPDNLAEPAGPKWLEEVARDLTALGGVAFLTLMTAAVTGYLLLSRKFGAAALVVVATLGGLGLSLGLKHLFDRGRPAVVPHLGSQVYTSSFPSGHSMLSAVIYLTLGSLLARMVARRVLKVYFVGVALALTVLVGCSRVYLGVHYPTDVLAGWSAGLVWAMLCSLAALLLQRRGTVEAPEE
jgi:undecaprenyl-diphosphatase